MNHDPGESAAAPSGRHVLYALVGAAVFSVMGLLIAATPLLAPVWAAIVLALVWCGAVVMALRSWRRRVFGPLLWALAVTGAWYALLLFGDFVLGWSA